MKSFRFLPLLGLLALTAPAANASALLKPTSGVTQALTPKSLNVESYLRGAFAKTTVTTVYSNPNNDRIEADFMYSAPKGSVVTGFAYWYGGEKVIARVVEKGRAAKIYQYITSRMRDPALIEMVGKNAFRARIFPVEANTDLKIEIQLAQTMPQTAQGPLWTYPLKEETASNALKDVKIKLHSTSLVSSNYGTFKNGELQIEKHDFKAKEDLRALIQQKPAPIRASLLAARDGGTDGFFALSLTPTSPVVRPDLKISGVPTYELIVPKMNSIAAGQAYVVTGRYRGQGRAIVSLNGKSFEVVFPDVVEKNNLASSLWAANRIEALSENPKNEKLVVALSMRFGVPSKWTSWLAIPEEERRNFKRQMWATDRADAARAYAQALARGDANGAKAQRVSFDALTKKLKDDGHNYAENEELQPLSAYLNDELRRLQRASLQAKYSSKVSKSQQDQWKRWAINLRKAGASDGGQGVELPVYVIEDELRIASRLYMQEVEVGRSRGAKARQLQARLKELAKSQTARNYGWDENTFLDEQAGVRTNALAMDIAANRASDKFDRKRDQQLTARLTRLDNATQVNGKNALENALQTVWSRKIDGVAEKWAREIESGRANSATAQKFETEVKALKKRSGIKNIYSVDSAWNNLAAKSGTQVADDILKQGNNGVAAQRLNQQLTSITKRSGLSRVQIERTAWTNAGSQVAENLAKEIEAGRSEGEKAAKLQAQLDSLQKNHNINLTQPVRNAWGQVRSSVANELAEEIKSGREESPKAKELLARYQDLAKRSNDSSDWTVRSAWSERGKRLAGQRWEAVLENGADSVQGQEIEKQLPTLAKRGSTSVEELNRAGGQQLLAKLNSQIGEEIAAKRENGTQIQELRAKREKLQEAVPNLRDGYYTSYYYDYYSSLEFQERFAWEGRAHESAYRLLDAENKGKSAELPSLNEELNLSAQKANKTRDVFVDWEKERLDKGESLVAATDYRLRPGDPLISVLAPADCRQVLAIMPDGSLLPLRYDAMKKAWEAHFDVPAGATEGDYKVRIVIVNADGARKQLVMNFAVDTVSPSGSATLKAQEGKWHLRLETDEQTDRVSALLPWNQRAELRRDVDGIFTAQIEVPAERSGGDQVRFILTDKAHNRTEVWVDLK